MGSFSPLLASTTTSWPTAMLRPLDELVEPAPALPLTQQGIHLSSAPGRTRTSVTIVVNVSGPLFPPDRDLT